MLSGFVGPLPAAISTAVYLYAPRHDSVPTGEMSVPGASIPSIPGDTEATLTEGVSWVSTEVIVSDGALMISGAGATCSGLAGIQIASLPEPARDVLIMSVIGCLGVLVRDRLEPAPAAIAVGSIRHHVAKFVGRHNEGALARRF